MRQKYRLVQVLDIDKNEVYDKETGEILILQDDSPVLFNALNPLDLELILVEVENV